MSVDDAVQAGALPHIDLIEPDETHRRARRTRGQVALEVAAAVPNLGKLLYRLLRDPRVPRSTKVFLGGAAAYLVSPVDLIPEVLFPIVGRVDDLVVLAFAIDRLLRSVDPEVVRAHWDGEDDALELAAAFLAWIADLMPAPLRRVLQR